MATAAGQAPDQGRVRFFPRRWPLLQIGVSVLTIGVYLLALLGIWLWRTGHRRAGGGVGAFVVVIVGVVVAAIATGGSTAPKASSSSTGTPANSAAPAASPSSSMTAADRKAADEKAQASLERALKVIASDYQVFHDFVVLSPYTLGNEDHKLRHIPSLTATSTKKTFTVSIRSGSGTTFTVHGSGLKLTRTCSPAGPGCAGGHWSGSATLELPKVPVVSAAEKAKVRQILTASVDHYEQLFKEGEQAVGTTQYANANAGLAAFNDPTSAASRFRDFRSKTRAEYDLSFLNAFQKADNYFTAANEPKSISTWRDDMGTVQSALSSWVNLAVGWQIRVKSTAELRAAQQKVEEGLGKARHDIDLIIAGR